VDPSSGALTHLLLLGDQLLSDIDQQLPCLRATDQLLASPVLLLCAPTALLAIDGFTGQLHAKLMLSQTGDRLLGVGCLPGEGTYFCTRRQGVAVLQAISHQHHAHQQTAGLQSASANMDRQSVDSLTSLFASAVAASSDAQLEESRHELAAALLSFGAYLLNRPPTADPRWPADPDADSDDSSSAVDEFRLCQIASNSVIIERVLDDKRQWINQYLRFLNESGLLACPPPGLRLADLHDLAEMALAARAVRCAQLLRTGGGGSGNSGSLFDSVIGRVVGDRLATSSVGVQPGAMALTASDLFYREVSRIPDLFPALAQQLEQARQSADRTARELNSFFLDAGALMAGLARDLLSYRRSTDRLGGEGRVKQQQRQSRWLDYDRSGQWLHGIANQLIGHLGQSVSEARVRAELLSDTADCLDLLLASLSGGGPLLFALWEKCDAPDRAVALAERYREFDLLIRVCESLPDSQEQQQMLSRYQAQLSGFSTHLAAYYLRTGKRGCLLRMTALQQQNQQSQQQQHHHPDTQPLAWLQEVASGQFGRAGATLSALARSEKRLASRKRSLLSMAKLAYLASGGGAAEALRAANRGLELLDFQDCLPEEAISDAEDGEDATGNIEANSSKRSKPGNQQHRRQRYTRVYTAAELIDKFTSHAANSFADQSELEFKRALDLLAYLTESDDREALRALVWARALLTDWTRTQQESQQQHGGDASVSMTGDIMAGSVFIRTAELLCSDLMDGRELNLARPPTVNQLLQCPAVPPELRSNPQFEYHVKVLHERAAPLLVP
uniref:Nucleoporin_C domain-containing protein n=1 Tax=Macrostomum lignano TaxID=282301 RepID=A0A1I8H3I3_9PLAT